MRLAFADVELDLDRLEVRRAEELVPVEPQVFDVLAYVASNADRVVTKNELLDNIWGDRFVSESALSSRIRSARQAVGDNGTDQRIIATVHGRGYRMATDVTVHETSAKASDSRTAAAMIANDLELMERDDVLELLAAGLASATTGSGRTVCLSGEAGLGKTAVVRAIAELCGDAATVLIGSCDHLQTPIPLGVVREALAALTGALRPDPDDTVDPTRLIEDLAGFAESDGRPLLLVLEDLHWADDASLEVLRYLGRRVRHLPILLILTYREEDLPTDHPLRQVLGALRGPEVCRAVLAPLSAEAVAHMAEGTGVDPAQVLTITGGNPLFVSEVLAAGQVTVPLSVRDAVLARTATLPDNCGDPLRKLSVVPGRVERWLVSELIGEGTTALVEAERIGLLDGGPSHIWFRHELVRRAVEETLVSSERVALESRVAELLEAHGEAAGRVMHHAVQSGQPAMIVRIGSASATEALAAGAHRQAVEFIEQVIRHESLLSTDELAELLTELTSSLYFLNRLAEAMAVADRAEQTARATGDSMLMARAGMARSRAALWAVGPKAAQRAARQATALLADSGDHALRAMAHADLARSLGELASVGSVAVGSAEATAEAEAALDAAKRAQRDDLIGYALVYLGSERIALGDERGWDDLDRAVAMLREFPHAELAVRACANGSGAAYRVGRLEEAERFLDLGFELARDTEFESGLFRLALTRAAIRFSRGEWATARAELEALLQHNQEPGIMGPLARVLLSRLLARTGSLDESSRVLEPALEASSGSDEMRLVGPVTIACIECAWLSGDQNLRDLAEPVLEAHGLAESIVSRAEITRYLQRAGESGAPLPEGSPEPWLSGLQGDWRTAAELWQARSEPYEQALELVVGGDDESVEVGLSILRSLGATATIRCFEQS